MIALLSCPGVLRTAFLGELIEELVKARGMEEVDFHMLHNSGPVVRRNGPIIPDNRGIVHSIGDCFRWEEREQFVEEFYASQYDIKERAMHRKKTPGVVSPLTMCSLLNALFLTVALLGVSRSCIFNSGNNSSASFMASHTLRSRTRGTIVLAFFCGLLLLL